MTESLKFLIQLVSGVQSGWLNTVVQVDECAALVVQAAQIVFSEIPL